MKGEMVSMSTEPLEGGTEYPIGTNYYTRLTIE